MSSSRGAEEPRRHGGRLGTTGAEAAGSGQRAQVQFKQRRCTEPMHSLRLRRVIQFRRLAAPSDCYCPRAAVWALRVPGGILVLALLRSAPAARSVALRSRRADSLAGVSCLMPTERRAAHNLLLGLPQARHGVLDTRKTTRAWGAAIHVVSI